MSYFLFSMAFAAGAVAFIVAAARRASEDAARQRACRSLAFLDVRRDATTPEHGDRTRNRQW